MRRTVTLSLDEFRVEGPWCRPTSVAIGQLVLLPTGWALSSSECLPHQTASSGPQNLAQQDHKTWHKVRDHLHPCGLINDSQSG